MVIIYRAFQAVKFKGFEMACLEDELPQRPLLNLVPVFEPLNGEALEAQLFSDCTTKPVDH